MEMVNRAEVEQKSLTAPEHACEIEIKNNGDLKDAYSFLKILKELKKQLGQIFDPIIKKAHEAHKEAKAQKNKFEDPLKEAESIVTPKIKKYLDEEERKRQEEERRLQEEVRKQQEEARIERATELEEEGKAKEAEEVLTEPDNTPLPTIAKTTPKVDRRLIRKTWKWRVVDASKVRRQYLTEDTVKINATVRAHGKDAEKTVGGIQAWEE
jgi:gas vesicle protein